MTLEELMQKAQAKSSREYANGNFVITAAPAAHQGRLSSTGKTVSSGCFVAPEGQPNATPLFCWLLQEDQAEVGRKVRLFKMSETSNSLSAEYAD